MAGVLEILKWAMYVRETNFLNPHTAASWSCALQLLSPCSKCLCIHQPHSGVVQQKASGEISSLLEGLLTCYQFGLHSWSSSPGQPEWDSLAVR